MNTTRINFIKIFLILFCIISVNANAQYEDAVQFRSIETFLADKIILGSVYKKQSETLKENSVKKIIAKDENGNIISETEVNSEGKIISSKNFFQTGTTITAGYDAKNNLTQLNYRAPDGKEAGDIRFFYVGSALLSYEFRSEKELFEQCEMRYDNAADRTQLSGFDSRLWRGDSIPYAVNFKYDSDGRLIDVRVPADTEAIFKISYGGNEVKIVRGNGSGYETYFINEDIITKTTIRSEELSFGAEQNFFYNENGLIQYITIEDSKGNKYRQNLEYAIFH